jgi:hypothetical protein
MAIRANAAVAKIKVRVFILFIVLGCTIFEHSNVDAKIVQIFESWRTKVFLYHYVAFSEVSE